MRKAVFCVLTLVLLFSTGCKQHPSDPAADAESPDMLPGEDVPPRFLTLSSIESAQVGLVSWLDVQTDVPTWLVVSVEDLNTGQTAPVPTPNALSTNHRAVVMGLSASSSYRVSVTATNGDGLSTVGSVDVDTGPLPDLFEGLEVSIADTENMQPGYTLVTAECGGESFRFALNDDGDVVFFMLDAGGPIVPIPAGNYLAVAGLREPLVVTDLTGQVMGATMHPADFGTPTFHHTHGASPDGTYLAIGVEMRVIDGYDDGAGGTIAHNVVGDVLYEIDPSGTLVQEIALLDILDPLRIGGCFSDFWDLEFPETEGGTKDWSHSNSITVDPVDGNYVVSVLHQNWVLKLDRDSGALLWRLGQHGDFQLAPGGLWSKLHHSAVPLEGNRILLYDNNPWSEKSPYSRAVEYALDTENWVATQTWEYQAEPRGESRPQGEVHKLANGNVLICDANILEDPDATDSPTWARIVEVTYPAPSEEVFHMTLRHLDEQAKTIGCSIRVAHRIPSLY